MCVLFGCGSTQPPQPTDPFGCDLTWVQARNEPQPYRASGLGRHRLSLGRDHDGKHSLQHGPIALASQPKCARLTPNPGRRPTERTQSAAQAVHQSLRPDNRRLNGGLSERHITALCRICPLTGRCRPAIRRMLTVRLPIWGLPPFASAPRRAYRGRAGAGPDRPRLGAGHAAFDCR